MILATAPASPPVASQAQSALEKIDAGTKPDHCSIAREDLNADGKEDLLGLMNGRSG